MTHRETIFAQIGYYFFGTAIPRVTARRKRAKELLNSLDNSGDVPNWLSSHDIPQGSKPWTRDLHIQLGAGRIGRWGGCRFSLLEYRDSRASITQEFALRHPAMVAFVHAFQRDRYSRTPYSQLTPKQRKHLAEPELTAKSYFLAEAEGLSRLAKVDWARKRGDLQVTNLQHDGIILAPRRPHGAALTDFPPAALATITEGLCAASSTALGYDQPVELKPFDPQSYAPWLDPTAPSSDEDDA